MVIFGTAIAGTRRSVSAIVFKGFKIRTTGTCVILRTFLLIGTCKIIRRLVSLKYAGFDFYAKGQRDSGFSRTVFDTFFNDDSVLNSKM